MTKLNSMIRAFVMVAMVAVTGAFANDALAQQRSYGTCAAYTDCYNRFGMVAGRISCRVSGSSSAGMMCNWHVLPYRRVACSGFAYDQFGNYGWVNLADSCARFW